MLVNVPHRVQQTYLMKFKFLKKDDGEYTGGSLWVLQTRLKLDTFDELESVIASVMFRDTFLRYRHTRSYVSLKEFLEEFEWRPAGAQVEIRQAELGTWAGAYGCAFNALRVAG